MLLKGGNQKRRNYRKSRGQDALNNQRDCQKVKEQPEEKKKRELTNKKGR